MNLTQYMWQLIVVILLNSCFVLTEDNGKTNLKDDEDLMPSEQKIESHAVEKKETKISGQSATKVFSSKFNRNLESDDFEAVHGDIQAPLDAQASVDSNKVVLVLNNDKNKLDEEALKRLARNPEVRNEFSRQFSDSTKSLGRSEGGFLLRPISDMAQSIWNMASAAAPSLESQALGAAQPNAELQSLRFLPNMFSQVPKDEPMQGSFLGSRPLSLFQQKPNVEKDVMSKAQFMPADILGSPHTNIVPPMLAFFPVMGKPPQVESRPEQEQDTDQIVGSPGLFNFPGLSAWRSFLNLFYSLIPLGSEITEIRVPPNQPLSNTIIPYKQSNFPKPDEIYLMAILEKAINKKTLPILWFHLPQNHNAEKTREDVEIESKLNIFEQEIIGDLKQLQELSIMANEFKESQLKSGVKPSMSLTTKLNLYEIPIYEITSGDVERVLNDEQVIALKQIINQKHNEEHPHTQIKTQTTIADDDLEKILRHALRMLTLRIHEIPWLQKEATTIDKRDTNKTLMSNQQRKFMKNTQPQMPEQMQMMPSQMPMKRSQMSMTRSQMPMMPSQMPIMHPQMQQPKPTQNLMLQQRMPNMQQQMPMHHNHGQQMGNPIVPNKMATTEQRSSGQQMLEQRVPMNPTDKARIGFFDDLDIFGKKKHIYGQLPVINYYYYSGVMPQNHIPVGSHTISPHYQPAFGAHTISPHHQSAFGMHGGGAHTIPPHHQPAFGLHGGGAHTIFPHHQPAFGIYGGGAHGSNAYGSPFGHFRSAVGDEEIVHMLQQHQAMPKSMMAPISTNEMKNNKNDAENLIQNQAKRSRRPRRKRSVQFVPLNENDLNNLRKTCHNKIKKIYLQPNETTVETLRHFDAESNTLNVLEDTKLLEGYPSRKSYETNSYGTCLMQKKQPSSLTFNQQQEVAVCPHSSVQCCNKCKEITSEDLQKTFKQKENTNDEIKSQYLTHHCKHRQPVDFGCKSSFPGSEIIAPKMNKRKCEYLEADENFKNENANKMVESRNVKPHNSNPNEFLPKCQYQNQQKNSKLFIPNYGQQNENENVPDNNEKLDEILNILHELNKHNKRNVQETYTILNSNTTNSLSSTTPPPSSTLSSTIEPFQTTSTTTTARNNIAKISNSTEIVAKPIKVIGKRVKDTSNATKLMENSTNVEIRK